MRNKIHIKDIEHTKTEQHVDDMYLVFTIAVKKSELEKHNIRLDPIDKPTGFIVINSVEFPLRSAGPCSVKLPSGKSLFMGRKYHFGHWFYQNTLNVLDDKPEIIDTVETKNIRKF